MQPIVTIVVILVAAWLLVMRTRRGIRRGLRRDERPTARQSDLPSLTPWIDPKDIPRREDEPTRPRRR
jgi:hypothetical protein